MIERNCYTITKCKNAKHRWNIHLRQTLDMADIIKSLESANLQLAAKTPTILVYNNKRIRVTFYKDGLIQVDSLTGTFPETEIELILSAILKKYKDRLDET